MRDHGPMTFGQPTTAIVLAGGASRRMGADKRILAIEGSAMLQRVVEALPDADRIFVVIDPARPLPPDLLSAAPIQLVLDLRTGEGPLAGLEAGLTAAADDIALVVPGDMPWLDRAVLRLLVARLVSGSAADLVCLMHDGRPQPFPAACRRESTLVRVTALLDGGERRLRALLDHQSVEALDESTWRTVDPDGRSLLDIDTPADLARAG